ncbi:MAG: isoprenylcysteine carboxylmethyltransferase family protein [Actinomycetaceae bacterium]|nr:isoprenylcysteine carboxylmethyltransferase family protein [Actinomycetaceae bacterium]
MSKSHLPVLGVGPLYVAILGLLTGTALLAYVCGVIAFADIQAMWLRIGLGIVGGLIALAGVAVWIAVVFRSRIVARIKDGQLVRTGVYAWVRHPIYSSYTLMAAGLLIALGNWVLLGAPVLLWGLLSMMMVATEERWMRERFGTDYENYCKQVNRCIPWPPRDSNVL